MRVANSLITGVSPMGDIASIIATFAVAMMQAGWGWSSTAFSNIGFRFRLMSKISKIFNCFSMGLSGDAHGGKRTGVLQPRSVFASEGV